MSNKTLDLQDVLSSHFNYSTSSLHTMIPGVVVSVDNLSEQRITVQPTVNIRSDDLTVNQSRPPIINVPLQMPITSIGGLTYPIVPGDSVMLVFSMRGLTSWKNSNGEFLPPEDMRKFDSKDCVAIAGVFPFKKASNLPNKRSNPHSVEDVELVHNIGKSSEVVITLKPNGDVLIKSPGKVKVDCEDYEVNASNSVVYNAKSIAMFATDGASMTSTFDITGEVVLNGIAMSVHKHLENGTGSLTNIPTN